MSHYATLETTFTDPSALVWALNQVGFESVEQHDAPVALFGYMGDMREEVANIVVRREFIGPASNDLGFVLNKDGIYQAIISDYDAGIFGERWLRRLSVQYSRGCVYAFAEEQGYTVVEERLPESQEIRLSLSRFA